MATDKGAKDSRETHPSQIAFLRISISPLAHLRRAIVSHERKFCPPADKLTAESLQRVARLSLAAVDLCNFWPFSEVWRAENEHIPLSLTILTK